MLTKSSNWLIKGCAHQYAPIDLGFCSIVMIVFSYMRHAKRKGDFMKWFLAVFLILLCLVSLAGGDIYTWVDNKGVKHFSNDPPPDAAPAQRREEVRHSSGQYARWEEQRKSKQNQMLGKDQPGDQISKEESRVTAPVAKGPGGVVMYATMTCGYCTRARVFFKKHNIAYTEYDIANDKKARERFKKLNGTGVPLIFVGEKRVPGFNKQLLRRLLGIE
jgi:glutaredoxin